ncbi:MAG: hypothetical protein LR008_03355 [Candidatus Pacebacteria bacterium]|nr:hypothetical protein [Candidatus Paceibacterota bacterium]
MSFLGLGQSSDRYGIIIDIGSGSVLTAIVHSNPSQKHPKIVWSHREHAPLRNIDSLEQSSKAVITALVNASVLIDSEGRKALHEYNQEAQPTDLQCSIAAPWSYTVTKTINYNQEESFEITEELIADLTKTIQDKISVEVNEDEALKNLGLKTILRTTMDIIANGYRVRYPEGEKAEEIAISHATIVAQEYLIDAVDEMKDKLFTQTLSRKLSFMIMLFSITREVIPHAYDVCLVDITYEATEIGVVRDGVISYCTHVPFGSFSLAREISAITSAPLHEAFAYLHTEKPYSFIESLTKTQSEEVEAVFESYIDKVSTLFHETGDRLSIPKHISLHADLKSESLFLDLIDKAARRAIKSDPNITPISKEIIRQTYKQTTDDAADDIPVDTALLLSAQFFHKQKQYRNYEYL